MYETWPLTLMRIFALLVSLSFHEAAHAWAAWRLGDSTARQMGRLSLNPLVHLDVLGTLMILGGMPIGWAKPVPVDPRNIRNPRAGMPLVAFAGPLSNLILAFFFCLVHLLFGNALAGTGWYDLLLLFLNINFGLAIFNLLPLAPLDGSKIVTAFMSDSVANRYEELMARVGVFPLLFLVVFEATLNRPGVIAYWFHFWKPLIRPFLYLFQVPLGVYPG